MSNDAKEIQAYLLEVKHALKGQSTSLIQDALYDTESHLMAAMNEQDAPDFSAIVSDYGSATEIAAQYIQMESDLTQFLTGPQADKPSFNGFFEPLFNIADYKSLSYFLISLPLSIIYFAWLALIGMPSFALAGVLIGLPLLAIFFKAQPNIALFEGHLINALLGYRMPRRPAQLNKPLAGSLFSWQRLKFSILSPHGWKISLYIMLHLPLSFIYFSVTILLFSCSLVLIVSPVIDPIVHYFKPSAEIDIHWYWLPLTSIAGIIGLTLSLYISRFITKLHTSIASYLLVSR